MRNGKKTRSWIAATLALTLGSGMLFGSCQARFKDAFVQGSKDYILNGLLPSLLPQDLMGDVLEDTSVE